MQEAEVKVVDGSSDLSSINAATEQQTDRAVKAAAKEATQLLLARIKETAKAGGSSSNTMEDFIGFYS